MAILVLSWGCSPKVGQETATISTQPEPTTVSEPTGPCSTFDDTPLKDEAMTAHVLYRDFLRNDGFDQAFPYWQRAYELAPGADGKRNTHYSDGIKFYEYFYSKETDAAKREEYVDKIFDFYSQIEQCYGEKGYVAGRKAFDLYYKYKNRATKDEIYQLFTKSMDLDGEDAYFFILNPFTDLLVRRYFADEISLEEAQKYEGLIVARLRKGLASGENRQQWQIINEYVPQRLEAFEGVKGFYDCDYYSQKYYSDYLRDSTNCEVIGEVYGRLKWGGCEDDHTQLAVLRAAGVRHCVQEAPPSDSRLAYEALRNGDYEEAIAKFQEAAASAEDNEKKAKYLMLVAKIYYSHLKSFPNARKFALEAANFKANWGEPYLLIGRLYASSGPLCGPGRGWDSQIVVWPAIDKWNYAKRIDPESTEEANRWINRYAKYMPNREDVFQRTLQEGETFHVGCWIQENTRIRAAK